MGLPWSGPRGGAHLIALKGKVASSQTDYCNKKYGPVKGRFYFIILASKVRKHPKRHGLEAHQEKTDANNASNTAPKTGPPCYNFGLCDALFEYQRYFTV